MTRAGLIRNARGLNEGRMDCPDIDGIRVRIVEHAYCDSCGRPAFRTPWGWHHDHVVGEDA